MIDNIRFIRKFRWFATFLDDKQNKICEGFVKCSRPSYTCEEKEENGLKYMGPGSWDLMNMIIFGKADLQNTKQIILTIYDGCGNPLEEFKADEATMTSQQGDEYIECSFRVKNWTYKSLSVV